MERYAIDLFDGHCDAVFLRYLSGGGLRRNDGHVDLERMGKYRRCAQFFALFGEPEPTPVRDLSGKTHRELFLEEYALFEREMAANADLAAFCRTGAEAEAVMLYRVIFIQIGRLERDAFTFHKFITVLQSVESH